jgi:hypothetical protein
MTQPVLRGGEVAPSRVSNHQAKFHPILRDAAQNGRSSGNNGEAVMQG